MRLCGRLKKVMSNKLIVRGDWIKAIVWAARGGTLCAAARRFISALHRRLRSNLLVEDACKSFLSVRQTMELPPCCSSWITVLCVLARPYIGHWQKDLIEYPSTANLRAFRVGTFVNTSRTTIHTEQFVFFLPSLSLLLSLCKLPAITTNECRCASTPTRARTRRRARPPPLPTAIYFKSPCLLAAMAKVWNYVSQSLWLNCKQIEWTWFN